MLAAGSQRQAEKITDRYTLVRRCCPCNSQFLNATGTAANLRQHIHSDLTSFQQNSTDEERGDWTLRFQLRYPAPLDRSLTQPQSRAEPSPYARASCLPFISPPISTINQNQLQLYSKSTAFLAVIEGETYLLLLVRCLLQSAHPTSHHTDRRPTRMYQGESGIM